MANVQLYNSSGTQTTYSGVTSLVLPTSGGGTATFTEGSGGGSSVISLEQGSGSNTITFSITGLSSVSSFVCTVVPSGSGWTQFPQNLTTISVYMTNSTISATIASSSAIKSAITGSSSWSVSGSQLSITVGEGTFQNNMYYTLLASS